MKNPKIRFKGFVDGWEERKLIEVCDYVDYRGKTPAKTEEGIFLITAKNVKDGYIDYKSSKEYISEDDYEEVMHRGIPRIGDVLITTEAPCGNVAQVNREDIALAQRIIKYRGKGKVIDNTFLKHYLLSPGFQRILNAKASGGTVKGIKGSILHQQMVIYPSYKEQVKLGLYLEQLSNLITLHQQKCEETKILKKYMLQKMFPQNGSNIPEIRFDGFNNAWEQCKLGELSSSFEYGLNAASKEFDGKNKYIRITDIDDSSHEFLVTGVTSPDIDLLAADNYKLAIGDILFARTGASVGKTYIYKESDGLIYFAGFLIRARIKEEFNPQFVYQNTLTDDYAKYITITSQRSGQPGVNAQEYSEYSFMVPNRAEQDRISNYLNSLDYLITLHQRKCNELQNIKKFMLQNMFV